MNSHIEGEVMGKRKDRYQYIEIINRKLYVWFSCHKHDGYERLTKKRLAKCCDLGRSGRYYIALGGAP